MLSRSKIAGPPAIVRFAVLKAVIGNEVPMSLIVPAVPNIGSLLDTVVPVIAPAQVDAPEKAIHEGLVVTATTPPSRLLEVRTPPPPGGIAVANISFDPTANTVKATIANVNPRETLFGNRIFCFSP